MREDVGGEGWDPWVGHFKYGEGDGPESVGLSQYLLQEGRFGTLSVRCLLESIDREVNTKWIRPAERERHYMG